MRVAVCITETLTRTIVVDDVENYEEAESRIKEAYDKGNIILDADNSNCEVEFEDDTENYLDIYGENFETEIFLGNQLTSEGKIK